MMSEVRQRLNRQDGEGPERKAGPGAWRWPGWGAVILGVGVAAMLAIPGGPMSAPAAEGEAAQAGSDIDIEAKTPDDPPASEAVDEMADGGGDEAAVTEETPDATADRRPKGPTRKQLLGIEAAEARLGEAVPTGRGVDFAHVEGQSNAYLPRVDDARFEGVAISGKSGQASVSGHAQSTAAILYGRQGLAPGVTDVSAYSTGGWARDVLRVGAGVGPAELSPRVQTHSWIAAQHPMSDELLARVDRMIDANDRLVVAGVNNGRNTPVPVLLASSFNAIAVGTAQGNGASSAGPTGGSWPGRSKPDVAGAMGLTSFATPQVAAVVARLVEAAESMPFYVEDADRSEVIKAVLLAGASKPWGWRQPDGRPLHPRYGAGVAHLDNSLRVLSGGPAEAGVRGEAERFGWWFGELLPGEHATFKVAVEAGDGPLSAVVVWHRRIEAETRLQTRGGQRRAEWEWAEGLADFDLLASLEPAEGGQGRVLGLSRSKVDNVEHVFVPAGELGAGVVRLDVIRPRAGGRGEGAKGPWEAAVAWRIGGWDPSDGPAKQ